MLLQLTVIRGVPESQPIFVFEPGACVTLGRSSRNTIQLKLQGVSRSHCKIEYFKPSGASPAAGRPVCRIVDVGSRFGTTVNRRGVEGAGAGVTRVAQKRAETAHR